MAAFAGALAGVSDAMEQEHKEQFEAELKRRTMLGEAILKVTAHPDAKDWQQRAAWKAFGTLAQTPYNKKVPAEVDNFFKNLGNGRPMDTPQAQPQGQPMSPGGQAAVPSGSVPLPGPPPDPNEGHATFPPGPGILQGGAEQLPPPPQATMSGPPPIAVAPQPVGGPPPPPPGYAGPPQMESGFKTYGEQQTEHTNALLAQNQAIFTQQMTQRTAEATTLKLDPNQTKQYILNGKITNPSPQVAASLAREGLELGPDGVPVPAPPERQSELYKANLASKQSMASLHDAQEELARARAAGLSPDSPQFKLAQQRVAVAQANFQIKVRNLDLQERKHEANMYGTQGGAPIPNGPVNEAGGPVGLAAARILGPSGQEKSRGGAAYAAIQVMPDVRDAARALNEAGALGTIPGRWSDFEKWTDTVDPALARYYATIYQAGRLIVTAHGLRTDKALDHTIESMVGKGGGTRRDIASINAGIDATEKSLGPLVRGGATIRTPGGGLTGAPPPPTASSKGGTVRMKSPNGQIKPVPADQVEHYKSLGAVVVQ